MTSASEAVNSAIKILDKSDGDLKDISLENIKNKEFLEKMYMALVDKYFCFRENTGKSNVTREKKIVLFYNNFKDVERYFVRNLGDATRADKIFIKKLEQSNCELREAKKFYSDEQANILYDFIVEKGLEDFYLSKIRGEVTERLLLYKIGQKFTIEEEKAALAYDWINIWSRPEQIPYMYKTYRDWETDRKSTRLNSSHEIPSRMPSSA